MRSSGKLRLAAAALALVAAAGCANTDTLHLAQRAESAQDYDLAVAEYTAYLRKHPEQTAVRLDLDRARLRAAQMHYFRGRSLFESGKYDDALAELQIADELNPGDGDTQRDLRQVRAALRAQVSVEQNGQTALEALLTKEREISPVNQGLPNVTLPAQITTGLQATSRLVYLMIARLANLQIIFDPTFQDVPLSVSLGNLTVQQALDAVAKSTNTFYRVTAPGTITVVPNTPAKQREYSEEMEQTFFLQNADLKETIDLLRVVADVRAIAPTTALNGFSVRDTPERLQAIGHLLQAIDKARPEVVIDCEILEVDRSRMQEYGLQIASPGSAGINGTADVNQSGLSLSDLRNLTDAGVLVTAVPALYYRLLKTDANTRTLANPHMRASDGIEATERFGDNVPVPTTTFAPLAQGGVNQQPITSYTYQTIGVNIDITPRTHANDDVSLALKVSLTSVSGTGYGGLPTFGNREIDTTIRLKDGETSILAGLIRDDERRTLNKIPGLSDLPVIGRIFTDDQTQKEQTDIVLALTPHIVRVLDVTAADLQPFRIQPDGASGALATGPSLAPPSSGGGRGGGGK